jgi:hypothetical protein
MSSEALTPPIRARNARQEYAEGGKRRIARKLHLIA